MQLSCQLSCFSYMMLGATHVTPLIAISTVAALPMQVVYKIRLNFVQSEGQVAIVSMPVAACHLQFEHQALHEHGWFQTACTGRTVCRPAYRPVRASSAHETRFSDVDLQCNICQHKMSNEHCAGLSLAALASCLASSRRCEEVTGTLAMSGMQQSQAAMIHTAQECQQCAVTKKCWSPDKKGAMPNRLVHAGLGWEDSERHTKRIRRIKMIA